MVLQYSCGTWKYSFQYYLQIFVLLVQKSIMFLIQSWYFFKVVDTSVDISANGYDLQNFNVTTTYVPG